ncbi:hypothetical protein ACLOJK_013938 [Asimina triloba]
MEDTGKSAVNGERSNLTGYEQNGMKSSSNDDIDLEGGRETKDRDKAIRSNKAFKIHNQALLSGLAYCVSSCSMILVNKFVLSSYDFNAGISLMLYQNLVSVVIVSTLSFLGIISTEPLTWRLIRVWFPVNVIFVGMLITSIFSLKYINVAMVTILKNVTNVITAVGEMYLFKKHHDGRVWAALILMIISAVSGGMTDITFHAVGYTWQIMNCFLTASYSMLLVAVMGGQDDSLKLIYVSQEENVWMHQRASLVIQVVDLSFLTLRRVMDTAKQVTRSGNLNEFSMVLLNNILSLPLGGLLILLFNEVDYLSQTQYGLEGGFAGSSLMIFKLKDTMQNHLGRISQQDSPFYCWNPFVQGSNYSGELHKHPFRTSGRSIFCKSQDDGQMRTQYHTCHSCTPQIGKWEIAWMLPGKLDLVYALMYFLGSWLVRVKWFWKLIYLRDIMLMRVIGLAIHAALQDDVFTSGVFGPMFALWLLRGRVTPLKYRRIDRNDTWLISAEAQCPDDAIDRIAGAV